MKKTTETSAARRSRRPVRLDIKGAFERCNGGGAGNACRPERARCGKRERFGANAELFSELTRKKRIDQSSRLREASTHLRAERAMPVIGCEPNFDDGLVQHRNRAARSFAPQKIEKLAPSRRISTLRRCCHDRSGPAPGKTNREPVERKEARDSSNGENNQCRIHGSRSMQWPTLLGSENGK